MTRVLALALAGLLLAACTHDPFAGIDHADELPLKKKARPVDPDDPPPSFPPIPGLPPEIGQPY